MWANPIGSMVWVIYGVNVGKYSSTMDPMGMIWDDNINCHIWDILLSERAIEFSPNDRE